MSGARARCLFVNDLWKSCVSVCLFFPLLQDGLTPYANAATLHALLPNSRVVTVAGAKHNMLIERGECIARVLERWVEGEEFPAQGSVVQ